MKKMLIALTALMTVALFATSSFAVNKVQMTLTSPTIYKTGCEKIGSTTYAFDGGSSIAPGDWWYMDLPENITLCKDYDYVIVGIEGLANPDVYIDPNDSTDPYSTGVGFNGANVASIGSGEASDGPMKAGGTTPLYTVNGAGNMAFLVKGSMNTRRIAIYALTDGGTTPTLSVGADSTLEFKLFDGKAWNVTNATTANESRILLDLDGDGVYGETDYKGGTSTDDEVIGYDNSAAATAGEPYVENTLCANAEDLPGQYMYTSYASKSDKFTFSGDSQIAHTASAGSIALASCKDSDNFEISFTTVQGTSSCTFHYEQPAASNGNYCDTGWPSVENQRFLIEATSGAFGDINDKYTIEAAITAPADGVYFGGIPTVKLLKSTEDECVDAGTALTTAAAFDAYEGTTKVASPTYNTGNCTIKTGEMIDGLVQTAGTAFATDNYDTIFVDFAQFVYGNTAVAAGEEVTVQLTLNRYPCGTIFQDSRTIGNFVTTCSTSGTGTTTLYFPWLPGSAYPGWWGGYVIVNLGSTPGTAALTYNDANGQTATYTTAEIAAGAQWVDMAEVTPADLTNATGETYDSTLNFSVTAVCQFTPARGFVFTGNGDEGTGYVVD